MSDKYGKRERYDAAQEQIRLHRWKIFPSGIVWSHHKNAPIGGVRDEYHRVSVPCEDGKFRYVSTHRVVWEFFNGESDLNLTINHKNGNTLDNHIDNLELITNQENSEHGHKVLKRGNGSRNKGSVNPRARLVEDQVKVIKQRLRDGENYRVIAEDYGVSPLTIHSIKRGANWKEVE